MTKKNSHFFLIVKTTISNNWNNEFLYHRSPKRRTRTLPPYVITVGSATTSHIMVNSQVSNLKKKKEEINKLAPVIKRMLQKRQIPSLCVNLNPLWKKSEGLDSRTNSRFVSSFVERPRKHYTEEPNAFASLYIKKQ